jgi:hypothetical protein
MLELFTQVDGTTTLSSEVVAPCSKPVPLMRIGVGAVGDPVAGVTDVTLNTVDGADGWILFSQPGVITAVRVRPATIGNAMWRIGGCPFPWSAKRHNGAGRTTTESQAEADGGTRE